MTVRANKPANADLGERRPSLAVAVACLPVRARLFLVALALCAALPAFVTFYGALAGSSGVVGFFADRPLLSTAAAAILATAALLLFEQPDNWSLRAYGAQLRNRAASVRTEYLAALDRRLPPPGGNP